MQISCCMNTQLQLAACNIIKHLHNSVFGICIIVRFADVVDKMLTILFHHFSRMTVGSKKQICIMVT